MHGGIWCKLSSRQVAYSHMGSNPVSHLTLHSSPLVTWPLRHGCSKFLGLCASRCSSAAFGLHDRAKDTEDKRRAFRIHITQPVMRGHVVCESVYTSLFLAPPSQTLVPEPQAYAFFAYGDNVFFKARESCSSVLERRKVWSKKYLCEKSSTGSQVRQQSLSALTTCVW